MGLSFAPGVHYRISKRGLVLGVPSGETLLLEHPRADDLPAILATTPSGPELLHRLGPPVDPDLDQQLLDAGILYDTELVTADRGPTARRDPDPSGHRPVTFSRSGIMLSGIATPSRWLDRHLSPFVLSTPGAVLIAAVIVSGVISLLLGQPHDLRDTTGATAQALLFIALGLLATALHELAHAVTLTHYGRTPGRAGFGFYWGAISFYVDSTPALTLPRRQRVVQALAGLATDVVTTALLLALAHAHLGVLISTACWRRGVLNAWTILINAVPVLEVDGHWALADFLDEPDLAPRARTALANRLRRRPASRPLAAYGAVSLVSGIGLLALDLYIYWNVLGNLLTALFHGNIADIIIGTYLIGPLLLGIFFSLTGLILESVLTSAQP